MMKYAMKKAKTNFTILPEKNSSTQFTGDSTSLKLA